MEIDPQRTCQVCYKVETSENKILLYRYVVSEAFVAIGVYPYLEEMYGSMEEII